MFESVLSDTKVISADNVTAEELSSLIIYLAGEDAETYIIKDNNPLEYRDSLINDLWKLRPLLIEDKVFPDPKVEDVMEMVKSIARGKDSLPGNSDDCEKVIIGISGGSSLDSAKAVAAVMSNGGDLEDYLGANPMKTIKKKAVKLILIPTTSGTGSEVTRFGVFTARSERKYTLASPFMQADAAILCNSLVNSLPPDLTASTGFDALSHAMETIWNKNASRKSDEVAINSVAYILKWLETAYDSSINGSEKGRSEMLIGAAMAGIAFNMTGTAAVHALSFILSEKWHIPHGTACSFTLEDVMLYNLSDTRVRKKLALAGEKLFGKDNEDVLIEKLYNKIIQLKKKMKLPLKFSDMGIIINKEDIERFFVKAFDDPKMLNNTVAPDRIAIYNMLMKKI